MVRRVQSWHSCWKSWMPCSPCYRGGRPSSVLSAFSSKASISDDMGCIRVCGMGSLLVLEGTMNAERYIKVLEQHMLPSRWRLFQGRPCVCQQDNAKPRHGFVVEESGCWIGCLQSRSFTYREHLAHTSYVKDDHELFSSWKPILGKNGTKFQHPNSRNS